MHNFEHSIRTHSGPVIAVTPGRGRREPENDKNYTSY